MTKDELPVQAGWLHASLRAVLLAGLLACPAAAQDRLRVGSYVVRNWTTAQGLPSDVVRSIAVTPDGWLWTDHIGQLARFDGVRFEPISLRVYGTSAHQVIRGPLLGRFGELGFVDGRGGMHRRRADAWRQVARELPFTPIAIAEAADGSTWIGGRGLVRVTDGSISRIAEHPVADILIDDAGVVWSCGKRGLYRWERGTVTRVGEGGRVPGGHKLSQAAGGGLIVHQRSAMVFLHGEAAVRVDHPRVGGVGWSVHDSLVDEHGFAWWATDAGLFRVALDDLTPDRFDSSEMRPFLPLERTGPVRALCLDRAGNVWAGSETRGLFCLRRTAARSLPAPADKHASSLVATREGELLLYTRPQLWRMNASGRFVRDSIHKNAALTAASAGGVWVAGVEGTYRFDRGERHAIDVPVECRGRRAVWEDPAGRLWFDRAVRNRREWSVFEPGQPLAAVPAHVMCASRDGGVWVDLQTRAIGKYRDGSLQTYTLPDRAPPRFVTGVEDPEGRLWLTSRMDGLWCLHEGLFRSVDRRHGLPDQRLGALLLDDQHRLWVNSGRGIFALQREHVLDAMTNPARRIPFRQVSWAEKGMPRSVEGRDGRLYFLSTAGWFEVDPTRVLPNPEVRQAQILALRLRGNPLASIGSQRLPLGVRSLEIEYTAIEAARADELEFSHRLHPIDDEWDETGDRRTVKLGALAPGAYRFRVRARYHGGDWGAPSQELRFEVVPYFYETVWFKAVLVFVILAVIVLGFRIRIAAVRRHNRELSSEIERRRAAEVGAREQRARARSAQENERRRVAHELHDGIGQRMALHVMRLQASQGSDEGGSLADEAREIGRNIQRISRALHPAWIESVGIVSALRTLVERTSEQADAKIDLRAEGEFRLPRAVVVDLYRIAQEALQNAVRHAGAGSIRLTIEQAVDAVEMEIRDDGCGFDSAGEEPGLGLVTMRERAQGIGAEIRIDSNPGAGTSVELTLPNSEQE
ncbi:MAG: sensor histidine kinase [Planctomycetota bacterium]